MNSTTRRRFMLLVTAATIPILAACASLDNARVVGQVGFLAVNYEAMQTSIRSLDRNEKETELTEQGMAQLNEIRLDLKALLDGNIQSEKILDYSAGETLLKRISSSFNTVRTGVIQHYSRTGEQIPLAYRQFNDTAIALYDSVLDALETEQSLKVSHAVNLLRQSLSTYAAIKSGGLLTIPPAILPRIDRPAPQQT